jgi:p-cumate 2,3-dioxygenase beta subunit
MGSPPAGVGRVSALMDAMLLRHRVETLLFHEADLLDQWKLHDWLELFADDASYLVPPTDVAGDDADPATSLFYVFDDRARMQERVIRLEKKGAHSEFPRSKTRHLVSNVLAEREQHCIKAKASFAVWRSKDGNTDVFVGHYLYRLIEAAGDLRIAEKKCVLDMDALRPHARISIIL